jgi:hypothetical protein
MHGNANSNTTSGSPNVNGSPDGSTPAATGTAKAAPVSAANFPEIGWRGSFAEYRAAMDNTTEASDVFHFATFWAVIATMLGREIHMWSGDTIYPNIYIGCYGDSGDKKTTAQRRVFSCQLLEDLPNIPIIQNAGSTEGFADRLMAAGGGPYLLMWEEFSTFLSVARWSGSTILQFLTETYDCPPDWKRDFRKNKIELSCPTPTILTCTTPEWFWSYTKDGDFFGGFGNRFTFLSGPKKDPISDPVGVNGEKIHHIKAQLRGLTQALALKPIRRARWSVQAEQRWRKFYCKFEGQSRKGVLGAALKRTHVHVRKLSMVYAFLEDTFPEINDDQLQASIAVNMYAAQCVRNLIELQSQTPESDRRREMEVKILAYVQSHRGTRLRSVQQHICRLKGDSEFFHRVVKSLEHTDQIELVPQGRGIAVYRSQ